MLLKYIIVRSSEADIHEINVYSLHPGVISTNIGRHLNHTIFPGARFFFNLFVMIFDKNVAQGAQTIIHCPVGL